MPLTANREVDHYVDQELRSYQVAGAKHVFKGGFIGLAVTGYAQPLVAGDPFGGIAYEEADNTAGANGAMMARVYTMGDFGLTLSGAAITDIGRPVFASDDGAVTFTAEGNTYVGVVKDFVTANEIILRLDTEQRQIKTVVHAVEDLAAGVDIADRAVHVFESEAWAVAARVVNQASAAAGIDNSNTCVVLVKLAGGTLATKTYNAGVVFPAANTKDSLGTLTSPKAAKGTVMTIAVTNGATANPGPFLIEVDYV